MKVPPNRAEALLIESDAIMEGHFRLSSGLHSDRYCQCARLFEDPGAAAQVARMAAERVHDLKIDVNVVIAPALGGILWGYELARALGVRSLFAERVETGVFALRRGFALGAGARVLLAEDVITTGKSVLELVPLVQASAGQVSGIASVVDRSAGGFDPGVPWFSLVRLDFQTHDPATCPLCAAGQPVTKPGSRPE